MWLVFKNKLKTQDRLAAWEAGSETNLRLMCCPLCRYNRDSRDHLFFQCSFASTIWSTVKIMADLDGVNDAWSSIITWMEQYAKSKKLVHVICKFLIAASSYFIWQERNNRLFSQNYRTPEQVAQLIMHTVRLKLMGFKDDTNPVNRRLLEKWKISTENQVNDLGEELLICFLGV
ncbi:putative reverse transcriptase zinc-binding domain-containing protein [Helianthus annuus]|nr:putative reverse transcriptase zinc-binding domain-containing protein [Helianthus annuus]